MKKEYLNYLIVGIVAIVILGGIYLLQSQKATTVPTTPVTALKCDSAYFNYIVGKPEIIVSANGVDTSETTTVSCVFNYTDPEGVTSQSTVNGQVSDSPGGKFWQCHETPKVFPKGTTKFSVNVTDNSGATSSCESAIYLP